MNATKARVEHRLVRENSPRDDHHRSSQPRNHQDRPTVSQLRSEIDRIAESSGNAAQEAMATFKDMTGHDYSEFREYWIAESREEAVTRAAWSKHSRVPDITRDELVEIVHRIRACAPPDQN
jgi:hypothetical protein